MLLFSCCSFSRETELEELWASTDRRLVSSRSNVQNSNWQWFCDHQDKEARAVRKVTSVGLVAMFLSVVGKSFLPPEAL